MEVCRSCMNSSLSLVDIFSEQPLPNDQSSLADMVNKLVACKVICGDEFPQKMCESCCINVQIAFRFKLQFEQCYQLLSLQIKQIQLDPLEIKIEADSEETTTRQSFNENLSPTTSNYNRFESSSGISLSRRTCDVEVDFHTSRKSRIDGSERPASSSSELVSVYNMEGESSTMLIENDIVTALDNGMVQESSLSDSEGVQKNPSPKNVEQHLYKCELCPKTFVIKQRLDNHMSSGNHTDEQNFTCSHCEKTFAKKYLLQRHTLIHTGERPYKCEECQKTFRLGLSLRRHKLKHTGELPHIRSHTDERPFRCSSCDKSFTKKSTLKVHTLTHTGERPFKCSNCVKDFIYKSSLKIHILTHTGERPYKCEFCHATFSLRSTLQEHKRTHTGDNPHKCSYCDKGFSKKLRLKRHTLTHTGERPFKCSHCDKGFIQKSALKTHIRLHTGELPYKCEECLAKYTQWNNLDEKERKLNVKPTFTMAFKEKRQLFRHIQKVHKAELDKDTQKSLEIV